MHRIAVVLVAVMFTATACSGSKKAETTEEEATETVEKTVEETETKEEPPDQGEGIAWADKSYDQQKAYMKMTVKPRMAEVFAEYPEELGEVRCTTCHGESAKKGDFEMPSADLPTMDFERWQKDHPEEMEFMKTKVVPEMAKMLGMEPYNPETQTGFGCGGCHPSE